MTNNDIFPNFYMDSEFFSIFSVFFCALTDLFPNMKENNFNKD